MLGFLMLEARCNVDIQYSGVCHVPIKGDWALNIVDDVAQACSQHLGLESFRTGPDRRSTILCVDEHPSRWQ
jgi:hypothetical protein